MAVRGSPTTSRSAPGSATTRASSPSIYRRSSRTTTAAEIEQDLKLRQIPMSATVRFLPLGRTRSVQPYIGAGIGAINWRYTETGEFVDFNDEIFRANFEADGTEVGPVILGGVRFPVADIVARSAASSAGTRPRETPAGSTRASSATRSTSAAGPPTSPFTSDSSARRFAGFQGPGSADHSRHLTLTWHRARHVELEPSNLWTV